MKGIKKLNNEVAEAIASVYLLSSSPIVLVPNYSDKFDFLAISKDLPYQAIAIGVEATKYPRREFKRVFSKTRQRFTQLALPGILMYINYHKNDGYFEVFKKDSPISPEIQPLQVSTLKEQISELMNDKI